jgi:hypothetical protein
MIDHDALSQLTCKETIVWLKAQNGPTRGGQPCSYYDRWLLPELGLNADTAFEGRPVGNHPEHMPWDSSLNKDVDDCVFRHCNITSDMKKDDEGKWPPEMFNCNTPRLQDHAYERVFNAVDSDGKTSTVGAPLGYRIVRDFEKCYNENLVVICKALGWAVDGCGNRNGKRSHVTYFGGAILKERNKTLVAGRHGHGGARVKGSGTKPKLWLHLDTATAIDVKTERARKRHRGPDRVDSRVLEYWNGWNKCF